MGNPDKRYEFRCPIHGFISIDELERDIINSPWFQRLRRIRQLAWTDQVYPGAMHTRFEHTLGVMHIASLLFDGIAQRSIGLLRSELSYRAEGLGRHRVLVRLAALLHDVGHGPFSHAGEDLLPFKGLSPANDGKGTHQRYKHEDYSAAIVRNQFRDLIDNHPLNTANYGLHAEEVASLIEGSSGAGNALFWRSLVSGQMDADRMDYLMRDSWHIGVQYGRFDLARLINTVQVVVADRQPQPEGSNDGSPGGEDMAVHLGVSEGGWHAVESLILARYFMFTQVYFHKTRVAYDHHLRMALAQMLPAGTFPPPTPEGLAEFRKWDDWRVLGLLAEGAGGEHGLRLATRDHFRRVYHTPEAPTPDDEVLLARVREALGDMLAAAEPAKKSWYKKDPPEDILVAEDEGGRNTRRLSEYSSAVSNLAKNQQVLLFSRSEDAVHARKIVRQTLESK